MSATADLTGPPLLPAAGTDGPTLERRILNAYRTELTKLSSQLIVRLLALICVAGPFAFAVILKVQAGTPSDAIFGVYVHSSGLAVSLVVLGFAGNWGFPLIAGLVAGDLFAGEDRHNTWKTILTRSCSLGELVVGKLLAATSLAIGLLTLAAVSSLIAGIALVGAHGLVGLDGTVLGPGRALWLTGLAWAVCVPPLLAYVALAALFSIASRNGVVGVIGPIVIALATQLLDLIGRGVWVHLLLIGSAFSGFYGLVLRSPFLGPLVVTALSSLGWAIVLTAAGWAIARRRDFLLGAGRGAGWLAPLRVVAMTIVVVTLLAVGSDLGPSGVTTRRLDRAVAGAFSNVSLLQQRLIGRTPPPGAALQVQPYCSPRASVASTPSNSGPGDWLCTVYIYLPQPGSVPFQRTNVEYDVSVRWDGCFKAQSPPGFIGGQTMADANGRTVANPLFTVYGCLNPL